MTMLSMCRSGLGNSLHLNNDTNVNLAMNTHKELKHIYWDQLAHDQTSRLLNHSQFQIAFFMLIILSPYIFFMFTIHTSMAQEENRWGGDGRHWYLRAKAEYKIVRELKWQIQLFSHVPICRPTQKAKVPLRISFEL